MIYPQKIKKLGEKIVKLVPRSMIQTLRYRILDNKDSNQNNNKDKSKNEKRVYEVN